MIGRVALFSWEWYLLFRWSCLGSICLLGRLLHLWGSECIPTWVGFHIIIPHLIPWYWWHVDVLLIYEFLRWVFRGGSKFFLHGWLWISCRLDGVLGEAQADFRDIVLNRSWWWTWDVGLWISLSRSWLLLEGWNYGLLHRSWIQILVGVLMGQARYFLQSPRLSYRNCASHLLEVLLGIFWQSGWD